ncbi:MAG: 2-oxoacid:acceptor oxidoreductase subunit alpha [bacterium]|nr:2-oxoacid:acceptor oxidoreductase subunit alpha [bacterium]
MNVNEITIGIVGSGGDGSITCGELLTKAAARVGLYALLLKSFGPQIRGGESSVRLRISTHPISYQGDRLDALVVFSWNEYLKFQDVLALKTGALVIHDETAEPDYSEKAPLDPSMEARYIHVPFRELAEQSAGDKLAKNMVMLGMISRMLNLPLDDLEKIIYAKFSKKGDEVAQANHKATEAGAEYAAKLNISSEVPTLDWSPRPAKMVISGNDAAACGALTAGCRFFAGYPITPSTEVMEWLMKELPKVGGKVVQTEDEISAMNMVIGAGYAGDMAMTATSGPGLSLKQEAIGLAGMAEVPCVILDVQRCGPSTGVPTKSEQSDLMAAIYGTHGDGVKVVLAPNSVPDCFHVIRKAFEIAEAYQLPVLVLSDQFIGHRSETIDPFDPNLPPVPHRTLAENGQLENFKRYSLENPNGVSPAVTLSTQGGEHLVSGIEHDETGRPVSSYSIHEEMNRKRHTKMYEAMMQFGRVHEFGADDAEIGLIGWGSSLGVLEEAVERCNKLGFKAAGLVPEMIHPLPAEAVQSFIDGKQHVLVVELSYQAQFFRYLKSMLNHTDRMTSYARSGAKTLTAEEIVHAIQQRQETVLA